MLPRRFSLKGIVFFCFSSAFSVYEQFLEVYPLAVNAHDVRYLFTQKSALFIVAARCSSFPL